MKLILPRSLVLFSLSRRCCLSAFTPSITFTTTTTTAAATAAKAFHKRQFIQSSSKLQMSSSPSPPQITSIDKAQMNEIIQMVEESSEGDNCNYVIIDVRNVDEINYTGKLSPVVHTLPLPYIVQYGVFNLKNEDFEDSFGFIKPELDQTLVFTCKAGIRSMHAAQFAMQAGYTNIINYSGGADDWFR